MSDSKKPKSWKERKQSIGHKWLWPFIVFAPWFYEWFSYGVRHWSFLNILERLGHLAIVVVVILYILEADDRQLQSLNLRMQVENLGQQLANQQKAKHYQAWQVINSAQGKPGSGGRMDALQDLYGDGISLAGVDISKANLPGLKLEYADLSEANLSEGIFGDADLSGADLSSADLPKAHFWHADLSGAHLAGANLRGAHFVDANLSGADLSHTDLYEAVFSQADLSGANFNQANIFGAIFYQADLSGANFYDVGFSGIDLSEANLWNSNLRFIKNWRQIKSIKSANIYGVKNPPDGFIEWATEHGAVSIEDPNEWKKLVREKRPEKTQQK